MKDHVGHLNAGPAACKPQDAYQKLRGPAGWRPLGCQREKVPGAQAGSVGATGGLASADVAGPCASTLHREDGRLSLDSMLHVAQ